MKRDLFIILILLCCCANLLAQQNRRGVTPPTSPTDTTVYSNQPELSTAVLADPAWFVNNNRFKDWDKNDPKTVVARGIVEKNGTLGNAVVIRSSNIRKLDDEALRLAVAAKYIPASIGSKDPVAVRSRYTVVVTFP